MSDNITSPLGYTTEENFCLLKQNTSGISQHANPEISDKPFYASILNEEQNNCLNGSSIGKIEYTKFESLLIHSITNALKGTDIDVTDRDTVIVISTTKGNISLLETQEASEQLSERISLNTSSRLIVEHFKNPNPAYVVSNACISGLTALLTAKRLIQAGHYKHAVVAGADVISKFILSGFQSFQAISEKPCKPFDAKRNGITLGEAAGTIILSCQKERTSTNIRFISGAVSNDANHISGPSRTGQELCTAVKTSLRSRHHEQNSCEYLSIHHAG